MSISNNIIMDRTPTKIKWKYHAPFSYCISSFEGTSYKKCKIEPSDLLFLVVFISFCISKYLNVIYKKDFRHNFSFLTNSPKPPPAPPLNDQNLQAWQKIFVDAPLVIHNFWKKKCKNPFTNCQNILQIVNCKWLIQSLEWSSLKLFVNISPDI